MSMGSMRRVSGPPLVPGIALLGIGKASRVAATFWAFKALLNPNEGDMPVSVFLFVALLGSTCIVLPLQRPWKGKRMSVKRFRKVLLGGCILALVNFLWLSGLRACGPLRALLLDGAELPLIYIITSIGSVESRDKAKTRGVLCMLLAYALLFVDASGRARNRTELLHDLESSKFGQEAGHALAQIKNETLHRVQGFVEKRKAAAEDDTFSRPGARKVLNRDDDQLPNSKEGARRRLLAVSLDEHVEDDSENVSSEIYRPVGSRSEFGVLLVLLSSALSQLCRGFSKRLAMELGGAKRYYALCLSFATLATAPWALMSYINSSVSYTFSDLQPLLACGLLWLIVPYYVRALIPPELNSRFLLQANLTLPFILAAAAEYTVGAGEGMHGFTSLLLIVFVLDVFGVFITIRKTNLRTNTQQGLPYRESFLVSKR